MAKMLSSNEVTLTVTGRKTTPFPVIKSDTDRKLLNTLKKVDVWLRENAILEAQARKDEFAEFQFACVTKLQNVDRDSMNDYLFGNS